MVSGRSGAGKSTVSRALEDMGYFVVDNLPPQLLLNLMELTSNKKIAVIIDVRETEFLELVPKKWHDIDEEKYLKRLIFLDASDKQLIDRYQETKRRHPLDDGCGIRGALALEQNLLKPVREMACIEVFTDNLCARELSSLIKQRIMGDGKNYLDLTLMSFGFKYGIPLELDLCFDVRFLSNPFYISHLRNKSGLEKEVADFVLALPQATEFLDKLIGMIDFLYPQYCQEGKSSLILAIGCTGGRHRSVAIIENAKIHLMDKIDRIRVEHRDLHRHT